MLTSLLSYYARYHLKYVMCRYNPFEIASNVSVAPIHTISGESQSFFNTKHSVSGLSNIARTAITSELHYVARRSR